MIDIHCHILPEVDDGAISLEEACAMAKMAAADGITHIVATPHCNDLYPFSLEQNRFRLTKLASATSGLMTYSYGCDLHLSYQNFDRVLAEPRSYTINQRNYLLVEFPEFGLGTQTAKLMHQLRVRDLVPIVTHPERTPVLSKGEFRLLRQLIEMGCAVQVTAGSLRGHFGQRAQKAAERLFEAGMVHLVASDAHGAEVRPPRMSKARAVVAQRWGEEMAQFVFVENSRAVIAGEPLPYFPEPAPLPRKKRFWLF